MSASATLLALIALAPVAFGAAAAPRKAELSLALCNGGSVTVPIGGGQETPSEGNSPGCAKACHSGCSRKRTDRAQ